MLIMCRLKVAIILSLKEHLMLDLFSLSLCYCSWDFIYAEYVMAAGNHHRSIVWQVTTALNLFFPPSELCELAIKAWQLTVSVLLVVLWFCEPLFSQNLLNFIYNL